MLKFIKKIIGKNKKHKNNFKANYIDNYYAIISENETVEHISTKLQKAFSENKINSIEIPQEFIPNVIKLSRLPNSELDEIESKTINQLSVFKANKLKFWELMHLYSLLLRCGLFKVAFELRNIAEEKVLKDFNSGKFTYSDFETQVRVLLERNFLDKIPASNTISANSTSSFADAVKAFMKIMTKVDYMHESKNNNQAFFDFVYGKTIAVVGPAKTDVNSANEIDSHDVVLRMNYKTEGVGVDDKIKGRKCDISNFSVPQIKDLIDTGIWNKWPENIDWISTNSKKSSELIRSYLRKIISKPDEIPNIRERKEVFNELSSHMNFTQLPKIVLDLLLYKPSKVTIFHSDLMLTVDRSEGYVPKEWGWNNREHVTFLEFSSRVNDPLTQFYYLKNLVKRNLITGDSRFVEVMSMSAKEFMYQLQLIYGTSGRIKANIVHNYNNVT